MIQNALQYLTISNNFSSRQHISNIECITRRFHSSEFQNQFCIHLISELIKTGEMCQLTEGRMHIEKLLTFIIKSREPKAYLPLTLPIFNFDSSDFMLSKIVFRDSNKQEFLASIIEKAIHFKLTHFAVPITITSNANDNCFVLDENRLKFISDSISDVIAHRIISEVEGMMKFMNNLNNSLNVSNSIEIAERNAVRKLQSRMNQRQMSYQEYYVRKMLNKSQDTLNNFSFKEANRKAVILNQSVEQLKRGKVLWLEVQNEIQNNQNIAIANDIDWIADNTKKNIKQRKFYQLNINCENPQRKRKKLIEYNGGLLNVRCASDNNMPLEVNEEDKNEDESKIENEIASMSMTMDSKHMNELTQSMVHLSQLPVHAQEISDFNLDLIDDEMIEIKSENDWDFCEDPLMRNSDVCQDYIIHECENVSLVTNICAIVGKLQVTHTYLQFLCPESRVKYDRLVNNCSANEIGARDLDNIYSLPALNKVRMEQCTNRYILLSDIHAIFRRRYQLQYTAIEVFLINGKSYFFEMDGQKSKRNEILKVLLTKCVLPNICKIFSRKPTDILEKSELTKKWVGRQITNYEYLMQLNTISGRTFNDLNQYPIFPWILSDFVSPSLDLLNPHTFRDLSKPIGALNSDRLRNIVIKYQGLLEDSTIPAFHYGSHYSNAAIVISFLLRLEPFASLGVELQSGKFDYAERLFSSMPQTWDVCTTSLTTFKELIPEFFYLPDMLTNVNGYTFGCTQKGKVVDDVGLPPYV